MSEQNKPKRAIGILQPGYLPWLGFFEQLGRVDEFVVFDDVQYAKGSWRNRNRIKTPQGAAWLTVPVRTKGPDFPLICDVRVDNSRKWAPKHVKTLRQFYSKAPFFKDYAEELFAILERPRELLADLDMELQNWLARQLGVATPVRLSSKINVPGTGEQRLIDIITTLGGTCFYEGEAGRGYLDPANFTKAGIELVFQEYDHPVYPQLHGEFMSHLSVIDLIFNCGPESRAIVMNEPR